MKLFSKNKEKAKTPPEANKRKNELEPEKESKSSKNSLLKLSLPFITTSFLVVLLMAVGIYFISTDPVVKERKATVTKLYTDFYANLVALKLSELNKLRLSFSKQNTILDALSDTALIPTEEIRLQATIPGALSVNLFTDKNMKPDLSTSPPINFAAIDLVRRTMRQDKVYAEAHLIDERWILRFASPIGGSESKALGVLLVNFEFDQYMSNMPPLEDKLGQLRLTQQFATGSATTIWQQGDAGLSKSDSSQFSYIDNNNLWKLHFIATKELEDGAYDQTFFFGIVGVFLILSAALSLLGHLLLSRLLNRDSQAFFNYINRLITRGSNPEPTYDLDIFTQMSSTLSENISHARTRLVSQAGVDDVFSGNKSGTADPSGNNTLTGNNVETQETNTENQEDDIMLDPLFQNQDALDIDMNEEDENLLNVNLSDEKETMTTKATQVPHSIFRAYDIRGIVGETLTTDLVYLIGKAIGSEALAQGESSIAVARDGRLSGPELSDYLIKGLASTGCNVINIGMEPTPVLYYAANTLDTRSGVMLTGSHNPANYNGLKVVIAGHTLSGDDILSLKQRIIDSEFAEGSGNVEQVDVRDSYIERITNDVILARPMKIVIDCGNGVPGAVAPTLFTALGCDVTPLYCEVDGEFPNHHPDPSKPENLQDLIAKVKDIGADIGLAFDGDGDRIGVVTPQGKIIFSDRLLMLYARDLLSRNPGADIIFDVKCTRDLVDLISSLGGRAIMWKTGHSFIKGKLKETGAVIAGEMSGHIFFNDRWYGFDDALYSAARLLEILSMETIDADSVFAEFPEKPTTPEINITVTDESKFKIVEDLQRFGDFGEGRINNIDGVRVDFPDCWGLVRASNTTPVLVARFEANDEEKLETIKTLFRNNLLNVDSSLELPF